MIQFYIKPCLKFFFFCDFVAVGQKQLARFDFTSLDYNTATQERKLPFTELKCSTSSGKIYCIKKKLDRLAPFSRFNHIGFDGQKLGNKVLRSNLKSKVTQTNYNKM